MGSCERWYGAAEDNVVLTHADIEEEFSNGSFDRKVKNKKTSTPNRKTLMKAPMIPGPKL